MKKAIIGERVEMTQIFDEDGRVISVTVIGAGPCVAVQKRAAETGGYDAIQAGFDKLREELVNKPRKGHSAKAGVSLRRTLEEFRMEDAANYDVGGEIKVDAFEIGDKVDVPGVSKGKGFRDIVRRWNANRGPMSRGSKLHRAPGSMGAAPDPSRIFKNKRMFGRMGAKNATVLNLEIAKIIPEKSIILIKGGIPGPDKGIVVIRGSVKV